MPTTVDSQNETGKHVESIPSLFEIEDSDDLSRLLEKPTAVNIERKRSFDERSFSEMSITHSPPGRRSSINSP
ncbi:putative alkaline/neutral invertase D [Capsicum chinense]|uniref:Uncharacterized protein n=1 Tax=Capsicum annuum TaxID=4072 RepID=A0A2G2YWJ8_CAPAN|nr:hypothetical protein FXO37_35755 [Capsicum annuum]KAF3660229.1 hypothetical protein FXO38_12239 [Capsicum annuum]PHT74001.1 hypothetical protein T459_21278 [Capsicum annuum]PHU09132.1 putative alkaline/neutral invertase D [Capsicum chinense]